MGITSFILGILVSLVTCVIMVPTIVPLLGWISWLTVIVMPLAVLGIIFACIAILRKNGKGKFWGWIGLILNLISLALPIFRLITGGGII